MYTDGKLVTAGEKTRLHSDPFGVRKYLPHRSYQGYTLFSPAWGDREYLIDMKGLVVHTWELCIATWQSFCPTGTCSPTTADPGWRRKLRIARRSGDGKGTVTWSRRTTTTFGSVAISLFLWLPSANRSFAESTNRVPSPIVCGPMSSSRSTETKKYYGISPLASTSKNFARWPAIPCLFPICAEPVTALSSHMAPQTELMPTR